MLRRGFIAIFNLTSVSGTPAIITQRTAGSGFIANPPAAFFSRRFLSKSPIVMSSATLHSIPPEHIPAGMTVHVNKPFLPTSVSEIEKLGSKKVFVVANRSSVKFIEGDGRLIQTLESKDLLAAPVCTSIGMGGGEEGLLQACDAAYECGADCILTVGGGAVQDAGKLIRLWLTTKDNGDVAEASSAAASVAGIQAAQKQDPMPALHPQIAVPNSFAMAEATKVAGLTTKANTKSGAAHEDMIPNVLIYDPALSAGLPDWVRFGTALRGIEHAVGAVTHPKSNEDIRSRALTGLAILKENIEKLKETPECSVAQSNVYVGGFMAIRALNTGCYPALGHLVENQYSARFGVHQGSCSGILCARIMDSHYEKSEELQKRISAAMGDASTPAPRLVRDLAGSLPGVSHEHTQVNVTDDMLGEFTQWMFDNHLPRYNSLSPKGFSRVDDILGMMTKPLDEL